ncbi:ABC transporter ATP-binding protein/permease [Turicibacter sanguinis]|jgi:ABC transporter, ATP-binding protein|uniref:ABC transporter ATP-binding protein/permease n=1 Tax=Turicibacter sanguinis TaxID=154288 RepID=UPI0012BB909E|nr:ABC transporter ATP-binding protein/permease [Turicibacter sanguinis]MDB8556111.1 ABC transporter ATP-binding protein/permease [Turicibacter sanguinis]MDB8558736.1 ABC transporter ATP-binding protein/permease [Turicibacter sanguinis]MDB8561532.1 ABC transporter ATP-binding protein/permease [Turicibacter sanguinis]MTO09841.1 ATP-binding cassette domain-containing protein [Turicibacter sanguinis]MTP47414.1 ATP-binding cassette domain-containing protein [Turicibacter sanguinis]
MLQIEKIHKKYITGDLVQTALNDVSLNLRDNELVAILGPSGSGKTTLLNIIGGLDHYDSGDLIINGISTKRYTDRDWDSYRNHTIGFVFQSYNLIPHQTVLSNVELALTISGVSKSERKKRAIEALEKVGLGNQLHKKPNQMSGGQMQRVAIARALINDPDILLADEPTGALDSETSVQVMELLKEVAKDRLVVMVTHNPELAEEYATRIVKVRDGKIIDDSNPYQVDASQLGQARHANMGKSSMSFSTSLSLSFNNLKSKKGRTLLTAFAGSIGIIGIALILSISNGVNTYISDIQKSTMSSYPISIQSQSIDLSSIMSSGQENMKKLKSGEVDHDLDAVYSNGTELEMASKMTTSITENNLTEFKKYLDDTENEIHQYIGENGIVYSYDTKFDVYTYDSEDTLVNTDGSTLEGSQSSASVSSPMMAAMSSSSSNHFEELLPGTEDELISSTITDSYDVLYGSWPSKYNELVIVLNHNNEISATTLYKLGLLPSSEYNELISQIEDGETVTLDTQKLSYEDIIAQTFYMIPSCDLYVENDNGTFDYIGDDNSEIKNLLEDAVELKVVGIIRPKEDTETVLISNTVGYTKALTDYIIDYTNNSEVVKGQEASKNLNVLNGMEFSPSDDVDKIKDAKTYIDHLGVSEKANLAKQILQYTYSDNPTATSQMMSMNETQLAAALDENLDDEALLSIYDHYISTGTYDDNMKTFGVVSLDAPSSINIYCDSFEDKDAIADYIEKYNELVDEESQITYTDYVGLLMSSVTTIINVISYVLIAFVAVSLIVSSIMIGIITYISVMERTKEIGILRAIGASKHNISQVFNAETFIIGICSGTIGIGITLLLLIPANSIIHTLTGTDTVNASLPFSSALLLIALSIILTLMGGFIPAKKAARKDPVTALRTE